MSSRKKRKIPCKFCNEKTEFMKLYNDFFCSNCYRFQQESKVSEVKTLPIFKLKNYNFTAQKYAYFIYNELGHKIASCERRDISKFVSKKDFNIRYLFFNDINRIIASIDSKITNEIKDSEATWKIFDYGRNHIGTIKHLGDADSWQYLNVKDEILAQRSSDDKSIAPQTAREFTIVNIDDIDKIQFSLMRKAGFKITIIDDSLNPLFAWGTVIGVHRRYYL